MTMQTNTEREPVIQITGLKKQYRLGQIGGGTLTADLQSWWARVRGKEDPNLPIGTDTRLFGQTFMALNGVDLTVYKGEALGIIGRNGAGKSTLLKILSRITAPTEGEIKFKGRIASMLEVGTGFNGEMTGRENIYMNGSILGMTKAEVDAKLDQIIEFSECGEFIDTPVKRYSSGMFVKLAFAVAAHLDSEIMVMDEVLAVGDMKFQQKCLGKMSDVAGQEGRTVLYVSHNMSTIRQLCTRCVVLDKGRVVFDGNVEDAIAIYMETTDVNVVHYDLTDTGRMTSSAGKRLRVESLDFVDKDGKIKAFIVFDFLNKSVPQIAKTDYISFSQKEQSADFLHFVNNPICISDSIWIGLIEDGNNQYTAIFNPFTNDFGYKKFTRESSVYDIIEPMFSDNNGAIISLISPELNDMCKNCNMLPDSITDALNEGNRVLLINSFKRK